MTSPEQDEFTELVDADIPRVDLVDKAANGTTFLIAKQADDGQAGLLDPAFVRELVAKAEPDSQPEPAAREQVTMSGSPAAIARLIHEAAVRKAAEESVYVNPWLPPGVVVQHHDEPVTKAKYDADDRRRMAGNEAMDDGAYPIADHEDLEDAIHAVGRGGADHDAIRRHIETRARALGATSMIPDKWAADGSLKKADMDDETTDSMDPTVVLAEPEMDAPGMPTEPGSPAWEAIDAATARKWTSIAVRLRNALGVMAERELIEATSADPDDAEAAWNLQDAQCALDYVIDTLAGFAVCEQAEAELAVEMEAVGKALGAFDTAPLDTIEALAPVAKAGRSLSAANEQAIRDAVSSLQKVLASLPAAPTTETEEESGRPVAKEASEETDMPHTEPSAEAVADAGQESTMETPDVVGKADGEKTPMVAVYDAKGKLVGIVDPTEITPISGADATDEAADADDESASETPDLEPAPAAEVGTPADAASDDDTVNKTTHDTDTTSDAVLKSSITELVKSALDEHSATQTAEIAKTRDAVLELTETVETLKGRLGTLEEQPAEPRVFTHGAVPPAHLLRGQDNGAPTADITRAQQLKKQLYGGATAADQNQAANEMQQMAITALQEIQRR